MDTVTWHLYPTQSDSCREGEIAYPSNPGNLFDEENLARATGYAEYVRDSARPT